MYTHSVVALKGFECMPTNKGKNCFLYKLRTNLTVLMANKRRVVSIILAMSSVQFPIIQS